MRQSRYRQVKESGGGAPLDLVALAPGVARTGFNLTSTMSRLATLRFPRVGPNSRVTKEARGSSIAPARGSYSEIAPRLRLNSHFNVQGARLDFMDGVLPNQKSLSGSSL